MNSSVAREAMLVMPLGDVPRSNTWFLRPGLMWPVVAPAGTVVVISEAEATMKTAAAGPCVKEVWRSVLSPIPPRVAQVRAILAP